jgi:hypothetical protein
MALDCIKMKKRKKIIIRRKKIVKIIKKYKHRTPYEIVEPTTDISTESINLCNKITVMNNNQIYRIGDLIYKKGFRWYRDRKSILRSEIFKKSLLHHIFSSLKKPLSDIPNDQFLLNHIDTYLLKLDYDIKPNDETLFISIRSGDFLLSRGHKECFLHSNQHNRLLDNITNILLNKNIKTIKIVTSMHFGGNKIWKHNKTIEETNRFMMARLFQKISDQFQDQILDVIDNKKNIIENIDYHFLLLCKSKYVILDQGGFSRVVASIRQADNNA